MEPSSVTLPKYIVPTRAEIPTVLIRRYFQDIIKTAYDAGINMFDTAEGYAKGKSEEEMYAPPLVTQFLKLTQAYASIFEGDA